MIRDADLFRLMQPARFGGFEFGFTEFIDINFELARGCGNIAWCASLGIVHQWLTGLFPIEAQQEVWDDPGNIVAGAYATRLAAQGANALFEAVGGGGLHPSSGIQRAWRDVNVSERHVSLNWDAVSTMYGQHRFGLEPRGRY